MAHTVPSRPGVSAARGPEGGAVALPAPGGILPLLALPQRGLVPQPGPARPSPAPGASSGLWWTPDAPLPAQRPPQGKTHQVRPPPSHVGRQVGGCSENT